MRTRRSELPRFGSTGIMVIFIYAAYPSLLYGVATRQEKEMREERRVKVEELGGILKRIGTYSPATFGVSFTDRLTFQKTIYLLQSFGLYLGYQFSWYIHGPYSTTLAKDGFKLIDTYNNAPIVKFTEQRDEHLFKKFLIFLGRRRNDANWLEILASIHILKKVNSTETKANIINKVVDKDPHFRREICEDAYEHLDKFGLI